MRSLKGRLMLAAGLVLAVFVVLTGLALDRAFSLAALHAQEAKLRGLTYALLGAADINSSGVQVSLPQLGDPRLQQPGSGLYALIADARGKILWSSPSSLLLPIKIIPPPAGKWVFSRESGPGMGRFQLAFSVRWTPVSGAHRYVFVVSESAAHYFDQRAVFRRTLAFWLSGAAALLLLVLVVVLRWGLRPLRALSVELARVEQGEVERVGGGYPEELSGLVEGLNALLSHERAQQTRYRHALDDLAHSLKTPLAVLRGLRGRDGLNPEGERRVAEQVGRMDQIVAYQLNRASAGAVHGLMAPILLAPQVSRVITALERVYRDHDIHFEAELPEHLRGRIDENDLLELAGTLLDNAAKWAQSRIAVRLERDSEGLSLAVEDDGPGIDPADAERLLERGARADMQVEGQGIGLAVARELARSYGGRLEITRSSSGGAHVRAVLPYA